MSLPSTALVAPYIGALLASLLSAEITCECRVLWCKHQREDDDDDVDMWMYDEIDWFVYATAQNDGQAMRKTTMDVQGGSQMVHHKQDDDDDDKGAATSLQLSIISSMEQLL